MAAVVIASRRAVRLANTHNVLTRTRPLGGAIEVGDAAAMDAEGNWVIADGTLITLGVVIGITDGRLDGGVGDDAEVLMEGIVAGYAVDPGQVIFDGGDGTLEDTGTTGPKIGIGLNDNLLWVHPSFGADLVV